MKRGLVAVLVLCCLVLLLYPAFGETDTDKVLTKLEEIDKRLNGVENRLTALETEVKGLSTRIDDISKRMDSLETSLNKRIDDLGSALNKRIDDLGNSFDRSIGSLRWFFLAILALLGLPFMVNVYQDWKARREEKRALTREQIIEIVEAFLKERKA